MQTRCPLCAARGVDLVFKFECSNPECRNFVPNLKSPFPEEDLHLLLKSLWGLYQQGESLETFIHRFFAHGGRVELDPDSPDIEDAKIIEPDWLRLRTGAAA